MLLGRDLGCPTFPKSRGGIRVRYSTSSAVMPLDRENINGHTNLSTEIVSNYKFSKEAEGLNNFSVDFS